MVFTPNERTGHIGWKIETVVKARYVLIDLNKNAEKLLFVQPLNTPSPKKTDKECFQETLNHVHEWPLKCVTCFTAAKKRSKFKS